MAEDNKEKKVINVSELAKRFRNFVFYGLREKGIGDWHEVDVEAATQVEMELKNENLLTTFKSRIELLDKVEQKWSELKAKRDDVIKVYKEVGFIDYKQAYLENLMSKGGTNIDANYLDQNNLRDRFEKAFQKIEERNRLLRSRNQPEIQGGLGKTEVPTLYEQNKGGGGKIKKYFTEWIHFKAKIENQEVEGYYPVPLALPFKCWNSLINDREGLLEEYMQNLFGFSNIEEGKGYDKVYTKFFNEMIDMAGEVIIRNANPSQKTILDGNLKILKSAYRRAVVNKLFVDNLYSRERENMGYYKTIMENWTKIKNATNTFRQSAPETEGIIVHFRRSFLIVDPTKIERPICANEELNNVPGANEAEKRFRWKYDDLADDILKIKKFLKSEPKMQWNDFKTKNGSPHPNPKKQDEKAPGLDENGWPLEVAFDKYEWPYGSGNRSPMGTVLKDIFNGDTNPRVVPADFVVEMDPLLMANCIENEWDAVRDDLRDGRYHANSLTIADYIMARTKNQFKDLRGRPEWKKTGEKYMEQNAESFRQYDMDYLDDNLHPQQIRAGKRRPTNLIPAFDKRGVNYPFVHLGRKFYYQTARSILKVKDADLNNSMAQIATGPFISSRGISQYIVIRVLESMKYFKSAKERLNQIASNQGVWYDYGPREFGKKGTPPLGEWS